MKQYADDAPIAAAQPTAVPLALPYAEVAAPGQFAADRRARLTYGVPPFLRGRVAVGQLVWAPLRRKLEKIEKALQETGARKHRADEALADPALYDGTRAARIAELQRETTSLAQQLAQLEDDWLAAQSELDAAATS